MGQDASPVCRSAGKGDVLSSDSDLESVPVNGVFILKRSECVYEKEIDFHCRGAVSGS